jgi:hypothetical protein
MQDREAEEYRQKVHRSLFDENVRVYSGYDDARLEEISKCADQPDWSRGAAKHVLDDRKARIAAAMEDVPF